MTRNSTKLPIRRSRSGSPGGTEPVRAATIMNQKKNTHTSRMVEAPICAVRYSLLLCADRTAAGEKIGRFEDEWLAHFFGRIAV